jgi:hypothetical protein
LKTSRGRDIGNYSFRVKSLPAPTVYIGNKNGGEIDRNILINSFLTPRLDGFDFELFFRVTKYRMIAENPSGEGHFYNGNSSTLTEGMIEEIKKLPSGSAVVFYDFEVTYATKDSPVFQCEPVHFTVR